MDANFQLIDKRLVFGQKAYDFSLYCTMQEEEDAKLFKSRGTFISSEDIRKLGKSALLYIKNEEMPLYKSFHKNFIEENRSKPFEKLPLEVRLMLFSDSMEKQYKKTLNTVKKIFESKEFEGLYSECKEIVRYLAGYVVNKDFDIDNFVNITETNYCLASHSTNVAVYALCLGDFMELGSKELLELGESALFHDLGKRDISPGIINKEGKLSEDEFRIMKMHSVIGYNLAHEMGIHNKKILDGIRFHHEKMDASGYPYKLIGDDIPLYARIIGICDIFDALTTNRCYEKSISSFDALMLMHSQMQNQIDIKILKEMILMFQHKRGEITNSEKNEETIKAS